MDKQETSGWAIVALVLFLLWWLSNNGFLHQTAVVQSGIALPGGQQNEPTVTQYCSGCAGG